MNKKFVAVLIASFFCTKLTFAQEQSDVVLGFSMDYSPIFALSNKNNNISTNNDMYIIGLELRAGGGSFAFEYGASDIISSSEEIKEELTTWNLAVGGVLSNGKRLQYPIHLNFGGTYYTDVQGLKYSFGAFGIDFGARFFITNGIALNLRIQEQWVSLLFIGDKKNEDSDSGNLFGARIGLRLYL